MSDFKEHRYLGRINLEKGVPPSQFLLYNHVTDLYYYGRDGIWFVDLRRTLTEYLGHMGYEIIAFYSIAQGIEFATPDMEARFRSLTTTPERQGGGFEARSGARQPNPTQAANPTADIVSLSRLVRQEPAAGNAPVKSAVILERVQNLVSANPTPDQRVLLDHLQSWAQITNGNVSILVADCADLALLPTELTGKHRSGVEIIDVGLPTQAEIYRLLDTAGDMKLSIDTSQRVDLIQRLGTCDAIRILDYLKEIRRSHEALNLRTLRSVMSRSRDIWPELLTEESIQAVIHGLRDGVIGQDYAIEQIEGALRVVEKTLRDQLQTGRAEERPLARFFFAGPTGVGKTEIFRLLCEQWKEVRSLKINMPEYQEEHSSQRLFGAPPGYVGHGKGELGQFLFENPASIILFDEFEKAHPKVYLTFLTMLEGGLTTGDGVKLDLSQSILIITSNAGSSELTPIYPDMAAGEVENVRRRNGEVIRAALRQRAAPPELIGRLLDAIIPFNNLTAKEAALIIPKKLHKVQQKVTGRQWQLVFDQSVEDYLLDFYERERAYGARALTDHIEGALAREIVTRLTKTEIGAALGSSHASPMTVYKDANGRTQIAVNGGVPRANYRRRPAVASRPRPRPVMPQAGDDKAIIAAASRCVVVVLVFRRNEQGERLFAGSGSGVLIAPEGLVLTNRHVIAEITDIQVQLPGTQTRYDMVNEGFSQYHDLALLRPARRIEEPLPYLSLANSGMMEVGDAVVALGYPFLEFHGEQTDYNMPHPARGYISGLREPERMFALDCGLNPGASGGALIALATGEWIGVIVAKRRDSESMGYALTSQCTREFLQNQAPALLAGG